MNRGADPLAIRTHRAWQPRQKMRGPIQDDLPKMNRLWFWMRFVIMGVCSVYALKLAVIG